MPDYHIPLVPGKSYHIFSRAIGSEQLFKEERNFAFFLQRIQKYILPVTDIFAYCLLPNHFHSLMRIKKIDVIKKHYEEMKPGKTFIPDGTSEFIMERFSNFLNSYTKSFNKAYRRKGALFIDYLRRVEIETEAQFTNTVFYIHKNSVHHCLCKKVSDWPWSSYLLLLNTHNTWLLRDEVMKTFNGREKFLEHHQQTISPKELNPIE